MTIEATAVALAETADPVADVTTEAPEPTEDEQLSAIYDKATEDGVEEAEVEAAPVEAAPEEVAPPPDLPGGVKAVWDKLPQEARDAVTTSQREMHRKLADQGRVMAGLNPIKDSLVRAARELPHMADMKPEQVADQVFELAKISHSFAKDPVGTLIGYAEKHGIMDQMRAKLGQAPQGQGPNVSALQDEIKSLKGELTRLGNPEYIRSQMSAFTTEQTAITTVQSFASDKPLWGVLEPHMPAFVSEARNELGEGASAQDVLAKAYDNALTTLLPDIKAKTQAADEAPPVPDPKRTDAVLKAKSINVTGKQSGKARDLTEDEALAAAYDRAQAR